MQDFQELLRMAVKLGEHTPEIPRELRHYVPQYEIIDAAKKGLRAASLVLDVPVEQLEVLAREDPFEPDVPPTDAAFRLLIGSTVMNNTSLTSLPLDKRAKILGAVDRFVNQTGEPMFGREEISLGNIPASEVKEIEKWLSGFQPLDIVTGGLYQALMILMGQPGTGKTSTMLTMAECLKRRYPQSRMLFFEIEFPQSMMLGRMSPIFKRRSPFGEEDRLVTGAVSIEDIVEMVLAHPNRDQLVFVDSPDAMGGLRAVDDSGGRRLELENIYRQLVRAKDHARLICVASQPRRQDRTLTQASVAESWAKAWYADLIVGVNGCGPSKLRMKVLKNRFGPSQNECTYTYNFMDLTYSGVEIDEDDW